jgi:hypothetical protein
VKKATWRADNHKPANSPSRPHAKSDGIRKVCCPDGYKSAPSPGHRLRASRRSTALTRTSSINGLGYTRTKPWRCNLLSFQCPSRYSTFQSPPFEPTPGFGDAEDLTLQSQYERVQNYVASPVRAIFLFPMGQSTESAESSQYISDNSSRYHQTQCTKNHRMLRREYTETLTHQTLASYARLRIL